MTKISSLEEYRLLAARTLPDLGSMSNNLLHMEAGIAGEFLGETVDILKKTFAYKKPLDKVHLGEELADTVWYCAGAETINKLSESTVCFTTEDVLAIEVTKVQTITYILESVNIRKSNVETESLSIILANKGAVHATNRGAIFAVIGICMGICEVLEIDFWQALTNNIAKLQVRYPEKFTEEAALNRDLDAERAELEKEDLDFSASTEDTLVGIDLSNSPERNTEEIL
jgi:hypothetical protein